MPTFFNFILFTLKLCVSLTFSFISSKFHRTNILIWFDFFFSPLLGIIRINAWKTSNAVRAVSAIFITACAGRKNRPDSPAAGIECAAKVWRACSVGARRKLPPEKKVRHITTTHPNKTKNQEINPVLFVWALLSSFHDVWCAYAVQWAPTWRGSKSNMFTTFSFATRCCCQRIYYTAAVILYTRHCFGPLTNPNATTRKEARLYYIVPHTIMYILSGTWYGMAAVSAGSRDFRVKTFGVFLPIELLYSRQSNQLFLFI